MNLTERQVEMGSLRVREPGAEVASTKVRVDKVNSYLLALEVENLRLTRLVGELLLKNQQLREKMLFTA